MPQVPIEVDGVWLCREGEYAVVKVERNGKWIEIIREHIEGPFSHICEPEGVRTREAGTHAVPVAKPIGWGRGMFIAGAVAGVTPHRRRYKK